MFQRGTHSVTPFDVKLANEIRKGDLTLSRFVAFNSGARTVDPSQQMRSVSL